MRKIKIIIASYIGSNIGFLFGEYVIVKIAGEDVNLIAILTARATDLPPVLLGMVMSGIIGTITGISFIKKGKIRAFVGGSGALMGLMAATYAVYNVSAFYKVYFLIYPLFSISGWELGMYIFKEKIQSNIPVESKNENKIK